MCAKTKKTMKINKSTIQYYFLLFIIYGLLLQILFSMQETFAYMDEIIALSALFFFRKLPKPILNILMFFSISLIFALLGNIVHQKQVLPAVLLDFVTFVKFFAVLIVGYGLFKDGEIFKFRKKIIKHCKFLLVFSFCFVLAVQVPVMGNLLTFVFQRDVFLHPFGIYYIHNISHPLALYVFCLYCLYCFLSFLSTENKKKIILIPLVVGLLSATTVATVYAVVFVVVFVVFIWKKKQIKSWHFLLAIPLVLLMAWDEIAFYFFNESGDYGARSVLLLTSFVVARDYFPLGSGFGTYATSPSAKWHSSLYSDYGLDKIHGLTEDAPKFISDSFYPAIIAETGFIGAGFYLLALFLTFVLILKMQNNKYSMIALVLFLLVLFNSVANASFFNILAVFPAFLIGLLSYADKNKIKLCQKKQIQ